MQYLGRRRGRDGGEKGIDEEGEGVEEGKGYKRREQGSKEGGDGVNYFSVGQSGDLDLGKAWVTSQRYTQNNEEKEKKEYKKSEEIYANSLHSKEEKKPINQ